MCPKIKHRNIKSQNWAPKNQTRASYHEYVISKTSLGKKY